MNTFKFLYVVLSVTGGPAFNHGVHVCLFNFIEKDLSDEWFKIFLGTRHWSHSGTNLMALMGLFFTASFALGAIMGGILICPFATFVGRKNSILSINGLIFAGLLMLILGYFGYNLALFVMGRFALGMAAGLGSGVVPMYLMEISPDCVRGAAGSFYHVIVATSSVLAYIYTLPSTMGKKLAIILLLCYLPLIPETIMTVLCPESPKYLMFDKEEEDYAEEVMAWFRDEQHEDEMEELREEEALMDELGRASCFGLILNQIFRSPLIITVVLSIGQQFTGYYGIMTYSKSLLMSLKFDERQAMDHTIGIAFLNLLGTIACMCLVDMAGRKTLVLGSIGGIIGCKTFYTITLLIMEHEERISIDYRGMVKYFAVSFIYVLAFFYGFGIGTIPWFYNAEICNHSARARTVTCAVTCNWVCHFVVVLTFPIIFYFTTKVVLMVYFMFDVAVVVFLLMTMRETQGLSALEITELFCD